VTKGSSASPGQDDERTLETPPPSAPPGLDNADRTAQPTIAAPPPSGTLHHSVAEGPGSVLGHYTLIEEIGAGGFGSVFLAEQREPVARRVALKILKLGMDTRQVIARFEQERQALAMIDHPHIAKVLDAGTTATGRPYFVMELVAGEPITTFCDAHGLAIPQRLELFTQACKAIQHAHHKGSSTATSSRRTCWCRCGDNCFQRQRVGQPQLP
jgi:serine/threonine protein kinase